jgi:hypothetical protein
MLLKISDTLWETPLGFGFPKDINANPARKNSMLQKAVRLRINKVYPSDIGFQNNFGASGFRSGGTTGPFLVKPGGLCYDFSVPSKRIAMIIT